MAEATSSSNNINVGPRERKASTIGGGALALYGLSRRSWPGALLALAGGSLLYRGLTGHCPAYGAFSVNTAEEDAPRSGVRVEKVVTINKPPAEVYQFWRDLENLPRFMTHLESVTSSGNGRSHWVAKAPLGRTVGWDAEITEDQENARLAWRSLPGSEVENSGAVRFQEAPGGRGTEVRVTLEYSPPGGAAGAAAAKLLGESPDQQVADDLRHLKQLLEAGEVPTTEGQPSGPRSIKIKALHQLEGAAKGK